MKKIMILSAALITILSFAFTFTGKNEKVTMIVSHEVKDYATWRKGFDGDEANRKKAGISVVNVYTTVGKLNEVTIVMEAPSAEVANGMLANPDLKVAMEKAGVISKPEVKVLDKK